MIDFGKTTPLGDGRTLTHRDEWVEGNREDGYLNGIDNMIALFEEMHECIHDNHVGEDTTPAAAASGAGSNGEKDNNDGTKATAPSAT